MAASSAWCGASRFRRRNEFFKVGLGVFTVFYGLRLTWLSLNGSLGQIRKQLLIAVLALMLGKMTGRLLRLQKMSNHIGREARDRIAALKPGDPGRLSDGFKTCAALYCAAPLAILGSVQDGLVRILLSAGGEGGDGWLGDAGLHAAVRLGGDACGAAGVGVSRDDHAGVRAVSPAILEAHGLVDSVNAVGGLLVFSRGAGDLRTEEDRAGRLPAGLIFAPLLAWLAEVTGASGGNAGVNPFLSGQISGRRLDSRA